MPRVTSQHKADRVRLLLRATWSVIARDGLEQVTLGEITRASGFTSGLVYSYFASRDEIVDAAVDAALLELRDVLDDGTRTLTGSPAELFGAVVGAFVRKAKDEPFAMATASMVASSRPHLSVPDPAIADRYARFTSRVRAHAEHWIAVGAVGGDADAEDWADVVVSMLWGYFTQSPLASGDLLAAHLRVLSGGFAVSVGQTPSRGPSQ